MTLFLFDIDGTLLLSGGAGSRALELAFAEVFGIPNAMARVRCDGKTDPLIAREVLGPRGLDSAENIQRLLERYLVHLETCLAAAVGYRIFPGVAESLALLAERGLPCGLATGNVEPGARAKLARGRLEHHFHFGGYGSDAEDRAELVRLAAERGRRLIDDPVAPAVVIGDTPRDVAAAHQAGLPAVAVAAANYDRAALEAAGAELVLDDLHHPERWVPRVLGTVSTF
jgi:phosphoglycolate phosphatase-like HAD superfamily hydrolase